MSPAFYVFILAANVLWFGSAFWYFWLKRETAAKLLIPKSARSSPIFPTMTAALPFLGGMNLAFSTLAALLLLRLDLFVQPAERALLLFAFALAHFTQFVINVPVAQAGGRVGESFWDVTRGPMLFIFVVDALMTGLNLTAIATQLL